MLRVKLIWSFPYAVVGLLLTRLCLKYGWGAPGPSIFHPGNVIIIEGPVAAWMAARGWYAVTVGWSVFVWGQQLLLDPHVLPHEESHVRQGLALGLLFPPVYLGLLFWGILKAVLTGFYFGTFADFSILETVSFCLWMAYASHPMEQD